MRKLLLLIAAVAMMLPSCKEINEELDSLDNRLDKLENEAIPTIDEQIEAINTTISNLDAMDKELKGYIDNLTTTASNLQEQIDNTNSKIDEVKAELESEITVAKANVLAQLEALRAEMETELAQINATIATLQAKDTEIENKIATLNTYVDNELGKTTDWANATFATLEQYNALVVEVAVIKEQINAANQSITALETYLTTMISADIAAAVYTLNADIQQKVTEITQSYTNAIKTAKDEITAAYTIAIQTAINTLDSSLKVWVGEQLANYYTITEIDAQLAALTQEMNGKLEAQKAYLEGLINELSASTVMSIAENKALIDGLQKDITNLQTTSAEHASRIAQNASTIAANTQNIIDISKSIYTNGSNIADNDKAIAENKALIEANAKLIADNAAEIEALKASPDVTVVKNAANIATNAENIATNAALIAANATAINNNAAAIANNAADILQLQQDLAATKAEITEAYKTAINDAITTNNGVIDAKIAAKVEAINTRIDNEVAIINASIKSLTDRMNALETEMETLKGMVADFLKEFDEIKETIERILSMIQSVSYVPQYSDGKAVMPVEAGVFDGEVELDFQLSPKSVVSDIAANWQDILSVKAVYTKTRAITYVDMPILSCVADGQNGIITVVASGRNLGEEFYRGNQAINVALFISDGNNDKVSDFVEVVPVNTSGNEIIPANEIWYTSIDGKIVAPNNQTAFNSVLLSNTYHGDMGVLRFDADVTEIQDEAFKGCANIISMTLPNTVETIGDSAFSECSGLHTISLGESLMSLGERAFYMCISLRSIDIPNGVSEIKDETFDGCKKLLSITIPNSVTNIKNYAFYNCVSLGRVNISDLSSWCKIGFSSNPLCYGAGLYLNGELITDLTIPSDITQVNDCAFYNCQFLQNVRIHEGVTSVGVDAFYNCEGVLHINSKVIENNYQDKSSGSLWGSKFTCVDIGDYVTAIGSYCFKNYTSLSDIVLPNTITSIGNESFYGCKSLKSISVPDSVTSIGSSAFYGCNGLTQMIIGNGVTSWGDYNVFYDCTGELIINSNIRGPFQESYSSTNGGYSKYFGAFANSSFASVTIGDSVTSIGSQAFNGCSRLASVVIGNSVTSIGSEAFKNCSSLVNIEFGNCAASIDSQAFQDCDSLNSVIIGDSVASVGSQAFQDCDSLNSVIIGDSVTSIGSQAFYGCVSLASVEFGNSLTSIEDEVFSGCNSLTNVLIGGSITSIGSQAFYNCIGLTSVELGNSVTAIGEKAFSGCKGLTSISIGDSITSIGSQAFYNCKGELKLNSSELVERDYTAYSYPAYYSKSGGYVTSGWLYGAGFSKITIGNNIERIGTYVFNNCTFVEEIFIPNSVTSIGDAAFYNCSKLARVDVSDLSAWCKIAFSNSTSHPLYYGAELYINGALVTEVTIPSDITEVKDYTFYNCKSLASITVPNNITKIGTYAFYGCTGELTLNSKTLVETDYTSSNYPMYSSGWLYGTEFTSITVGNNIEKIGSYLFRGCSTLTNVSMPESLTSIGSSAFYQCTSLIDVTIPENVASVGASAFYYCSKLKNVYCKPSIPPTGGSSMFSSNASGRKIYVSTDSVDAYKSASNWSSYSSYIEPYTFE